MRAAGAGVQVGVPLNFFVDRLCRPRIAATKKYKTLHPYLDSPTRKLSMRFDIRKAIELQTR